jgi:Ca-activated chloride channel homolog
LSTHFIDYFALSFEHPKWLWALSSIALLWLMLSLYARWRRQQQQRLQAGQWLKIERKQRFWWRSSLKLAALACFLVAFSNPQYGVKQTGEIQKSADIFIAIDVSRSMLCTDVKPNRMTQAQIFAQQLIRELSGNRIGIIYFAGRAYLEMPLSTDYSTALRLMADASPELLSAQGTDIAPVVELAQRSIDRSHQSGRALVLITDGEDHEGSAASAMAEALDRDGLLSFVVGVGTKDGGAVPLRSGGQLYDSDGRPVLSQLNEAGLKALAAAGAGGPLANVAAGQQAIAQLRNALNTLNKRAVAIRVFEERASIYQWVVGMGIIFLLLSFLLHLRPNY